MEPALLTTPASDEFITVITQENTKFQVPLETMKASQTFIDFRESLNFAGEAFTTFHTPSLKASDFSGLLRWLREPSSPAGQSGGKFDFENRAPLPGDFPSLMKWVRAASYLDMQAVLGKICEAAASFICSRTCAELGDALRATPKIDSLPTPGGAKLRVSKKLRAGARPDLDSGEFQEAAYALVKFCQNDSSTTKAKQAAAMARYEQVRAKLTEVGGIATPDRPPDLLVLRDYVAWGCLSQLRTFFLSFPEAERHKALASLLQKRDFITLDWLAREKKARADVTGDFLKGQLTLAFLSNDFQAAEWLLACIEGKEDRRMDRMDVLLTAGARPEHMCMMRWMLNRVTFARTELSGVLYTKAVKFGNFLFASEIAQRVRLTAGDASGMVTSMIREGNLAVLRYLGDYWSFKKISASFQTEAKSWFREAMALCDPEIVVWIKDTFCLGTEEVKDYRKFTWEVKQSESEYAFWACMRAIAPDPTPVESAARLSEAEEKADGGEGDGGEGDGGEGDGLADYDYEFSDDGS